MLNFIKNFLLVVHDSGVVDNSQSPNPQPSNTTNTTTALRGNYIIFLGAIFLGIIIATTIYICNEIYKSKKGSKE